MNVIKQSFIDKGVKVDDDFNMIVFRGLNKIDSESELLTGPPEVGSQVSEWQVNQ